GRMGVVPAGGHVVPPGERLLDIDLSSDGLAGPGRLASLGDHLAGAEQRLRRHARPVAALAGDQLALADCDPQAALGEVLGADQARDPGPDHDRVVALAHLPSPKSPNGSSRSRTACLKPASAARCWKAKPSGVWRAIPSKRTPSS